MKTICHRLPLTVKSPPEFITGITLMKHADHSGQKWQGSGHGTWACHAVFSLKQNSNDIKETKMDIIIEIN